jgi:hypothetical protein
MGGNSGKLTILEDGSLADIPEEGPVFGRRRWLEATSRATPFPLSVVKVYLGDAFAAYLPIQTIRRGFLARAFTPVFTYYGGPYFVGEKRGHFHEEVRQRFEIQSALCAWLESRYHHCLLLPEECDTRAPMERGWTCTPRHTVINRLDAGDSLVLGRDAGKRVRKAEKMGYVLGESSAPGGAGDRFEAAFERTFRRKGLQMAWKAGWAGAMRKELAGSDMLENLSVRTPEGREIAFASVALDPARDSAILWHSCSLEEADATGGMHFLYHRLIERYHGRFAIFDLCGADHRGISEFKEKFGNALVVRHALERHRGPLSRALFTAFAAARTALSGRG